MEQKRYDISEEQLNSIESEFMTRDALSLIVNEVRSAPEKPRVLSDGETRALLMGAYEIMQKYEGERGMCLLYELDNGYCSRACPFSSRNYDGKCGMRVAKSNLRKYLGVD